jgi:hypothetical protein
MTTRLLSTFLGFVLLIPAFGISAAAAEEKSKEKNATFELKEVPIFDGGNAGQSFWRAMNIQCSTTPLKEVKAYPKLNSKRPLYGKLQFARMSPGKEEAPIYFVLDESGEKPAVEKKADEKKATEETAVEKKATEEKATEKKTEGKSAAKKDLKAVKLRKITRRPVASKPAKPSSYDRLYIDANRDGDLTNDPVIKPMKDPPWNLIPDGMGRLMYLDGGQQQPPSVEKERMAFEPVAIDVDYGPGVGVRPFKVFSWFVLSSGQKTPVLRFAAATARKGPIKIGKGEFEVLLVQNVLTGRFDTPTTALSIMPSSKANGRGAVVAYNAESMLGMLQQNGDDFFTITATPLGDKLTVELYRGPFGVFKVAPGKGKAKNVTFQGLFRSNKASCYAGQSPTNPSAKMVTECKLPVGDYPTFYLTIDYGGMNVSIGSNYYSQQQPGSPPSHGIQICADKPCVLDFGKKPDIIFQSPAADKPLKRGTDVRVATILVDPKADIMVRGLTDPKRTTKETFKYRVGKEERVFTYNKVFSYDPTITITNSAGKKVAEGVMPFG